MPVPQVSETELSQAQPSSPTRSQLGRYRLLFERTRDIVLIVGSDGRILEVNQAAADAYGYTRDELCGLPIATLREASTMTVLADQLHMAAHGEINFETTHQRRDGSPFAVEVHAASASVDGERLILSIIRDITERKQAQERLLESERKAAEEYRQLLSRIAPLAHALGTADDLITMYRELRDFVKAEMPCDGFFVSLYDEHNDERTAAYVWAEDQGEVDIRSLPPIPLKGAAGPNARAVREAKTIVVADYGNVMARSRQTVIVGEDDGRRPRSSIASPMFVMRKIIGTVEVQSYLPAVFTDEHAVALELAANLSAVAIDQFFAKAALKESEEALRSYNEKLEDHVRLRTEELARTNEELVNENRHRKLLEKQRADLLAKLVTTQEDERRRIARDLHDHIGQQLTALELKVELLLQKYAPNSELVSDLRETQIITQGLNYDVDILAWQLRPTTLDDNGFLPALRNYIQEWMNRYETNVKFWCEERLDKTLCLKPEAETNLYRIVQEALNNVAKYAQASQVDILLDLAESDLRLIIEDNGVGFDVEDTSPSDDGRRSMGIISMRERAALVGGSFRIESTRGTGTSLFVSVPCSHR